MGGGDIAFALKLLIQDGVRVRRERWKKGMHLVEGLMTKNGREVQCIYIVHERGKHVWVPEQHDMFAEDWQQA